MYTEPGDHRADHRNSIRYCQHKGRGGDVQQKTADEASEDAADSKHGGKHGLPLYKIRRGKQPVGISRRARIVQGIAAGFHKLRQVEDRHGFCQQDQGEFQNEKQDRYAQQAVNGKLFVHFIKRAHDRQFHSGADGHGQTHFRSASSDRCYDLDRKKVSGDKQHEKDHHAAEQKQHKAPVSPAELPKGQRRCSCGSFRFRIPGLGTWEIFGRCISCGSGGRCFARYFPEGKEYCEKSGEKCYVKNRQQRFAVLGYQPADDHRSNGIADGADASAESEIQPDARMFQYKAKGIDHRLERKLQCKYENNTDRSWQQIHRRDQAGGQYDHDQQHEYADHLDRERFLFVQQCPQGRLQNSGGAVGHCQYDAYDGIGIPLSKQVNRSISDGEAVRCLIKSVEHCVSWV